MKQPVQWKVRVFFFRGSNDPKNVLLKLRGIWLCASMDKKHCITLYCTCVVFWIPSRELTYPPDKAYLKIIFLFPRWDKLISRRVCVLPFLFKFIEVGNTMFPQGQQKTTGFSPGKAVTFLGFVGFSQGQVTSRMACGWKSTPMRWQPCVATWRRSLWDFGGGWSLEWRGACFGTLGGVMNGAKDDVFSCVCWGVFFFEPQNPASHQGSLKNVMLGEEYVMKRLRKLWMGPVIRTYLFQVPFQVQRHPTGVLVCFVYIFNIYT